MEEIIEKSQGVWKVIAIICLSALMSGAGFWITIGTKVITHSDLETYVADAINKSRLEMDRASINDSKATTIENTRMAMKLDYIIAELSDIKKAQNQFADRITKLERFTPEKGQ